MQYNFSDKVSSLKPSAIREIFKLAADPSVIAFSAGNPSPLSFPVDKIKTISKEIYETSSTLALQYGITEGYTPLREKVRARLLEKFSIGRDFDDTIIVSGGQQGIELFTKVICNEGDTIICEGPSFIGALNAFRSYGAKLFGVPMENDGMNMEQLENALKTNKNVRFIYTIPTFQNPMGVTMSLEKRIAMYKLAQKYDVLILEDNPYGELRFAGEDVPTIKSMDTDGRVVYCGSFSKIFAPGIRVGFVCANSQIISKIVVAKQVSDVHTNVYFQVMVDKFIEKYDLDEHISHIRKLYSDKCALMLNCMDRHFPKNTTYTRPQGGMFIWCDIKNADGAAFAKKAVQNKVAVVPGSTFMVDENAICSGFRLNYSMPSDENIINGIEMLSKLI